MRNTNRYSRRIIEDYVLVGYYRFPQWVYSVVALIIIIIIIMIMVIIVLVLIVIIIIIHMNALFRLLIVECVFIRTSKSRSLCTHNSVCLAVTMEKCIILSFLLITHKRMFLFVSLLLCVC